MQTLNERYDDKQNKSNKRPKSSSRFPKQMPSYIVAFAVHETYDDIVTAQQMICKKKSHQSSADSVSPAISSKTITIDHNSAPKIPTTESAEIPDEQKYNAEDENALHDENKENENQLPETTDYIVVDNKEENDVKKQDEDMHVIQPKQFRRQSNRLSKKKRQNHCRVKNVNFKYKKLLKREETINRKTACAAKIKETFYCNSVTRMISPTSLLKSVVAKENILDTADSIFSDDENNNESLHSSPSTAKKSFISYSSEDTLTRQGSASSKNEDLKSLDTINSVIKMPSQREIPYKTEVINVSVAVAYNPATNDSKRNIPSNEPYRSIFDRDLLSTETLVQPSNMLTSDSASSAASENVKPEIENNENSEVTLKPQMESDTTYVVGNTSSDAGDSMRSESTLAPNSETFMYAENLRQTPPPLLMHETEKMHERPGLLDTVINMGIFPEMNQSTSSGVNFREELNSVFVTEDSGKFLKTSKYSGDTFSDKKLKQSEFFSTLKKTCDVNRDIHPIKNLNLPNECAIKAIINETDKIETKFWTRDLENHPGNIAELWDRLVLVVDCAVRRLENSLTEKVVNEIRKALPVYEKVASRLKDDIFGIDVEKSQGDATMSTRDMSVEKNESLQCTLIGNQAIDNLMFKLSVEGPQAPPLGAISKALSKEKKPKVFRDYFEVLKPPTVESAIVEGKGDTVTVSTTTPSEIGVVEASTSGVKRILSGPVMFLRENLLVISSVPSFFVMLLCVYGVVVLCVKPW